MEERLEVILEILKRDGKVRVRDLSEKFNVSEGMIRKDLSKLEQYGNIKRTYGGAILERKIIHNDNTTARIISNIEEKEKIAKLVMDEIEENDVIFMDISSTNYTVATMMADFKKNITLITNMNRIAMAFDSIPNVDIIQLGGRYYKKTGGTVGAFTVEQINKFRIDKAFIGAGGINIENNFVSNFNLDEVSTKEAIIRSSKKRYLITINEKFYNDGSYKFCGLEDIDYIITDKKPEENIVDGLSKYNVKVIY